MSVVHETDSPSSTPEQSPDVQPSSWDSVTATPQRSWRSINSMIAGSVMAGMMLTSQGTTVLAETPKDTIQIGAEAAQPNGQTHVRVERTDTTTMTDITSKPDLRRLFDFRDRSAVTSFLQENPVLYSILPTAYYNVSSYFGKGTPVVLEVFSDPEEEYQQLFLQIRTRLPADDAERRLDALYDGWWLDVVPMLEHTMAIDIELV